MAVAVVVNVVVVVVVVVILVILVIVAVVVIVDERPRVCCDQDEDSPRVCRRRGRWTTDTEMGETDDLESKWGRESGQDGRS